MCVLVCLSVLFESENLGYWSQDEMSDILQMPGVMSRYSTTHEYSHDSNICCGWHFCESGILNTGIFSEPMFMWQDCKAR